MNNNLYQAYYVMGLDVNVPFNNNFYANPRAFNLSPQIISRFPVDEASHIVIPDEIVLMHVFPRGYHIIKEKPKRQFTTFHFSLDNIPFSFSENGNIHDNKVYNKLYFTSLLFYENLFNYHLIKAKYKNENNHDQNDLKEIQKYFIPKVITLCSLLPFQRETQKILKILYTNYSANYNSIAFPLEKIIEHLICTVPIPSRGKYYINYKILNDQITFSQTPVNSIPNGSLDLNLIFNTFKIEELLKIYKCILLEIPLIFYSTDLEKLTTITEGLVSLTYPFEYKYPFISILPNNNYSLIETSPSFVVGVNENIFWKDDKGQNFFERNNIEIEDKTVICVDIDAEKNQITPLKPKSAETPCIYLNDLNLNSSENQKYINNVYDNIDFPIHYKKKTIKLLIEYLKQLKDKVIPKEDKSTFNYFIREQFFYFLISILVDYQDYIKIGNLQAFDEKYIMKKSNVITIEDIFDTNAFTNNAKTCDMGFYKRFLSTKTFLDFMIRKLYPKDTMEKLSIIFFDEKCLAKRNRFFFSRSTKTPLLENKALTTMEKPIDLPLPKQFTKEEIAYISTPENKRGALLYFQDYSPLSQIDSSQQNKTFKALYPIFPKLLYDNKYFDKPLVKLCPHTDLLMQMEKTFDSIISDKKFTNIYNNDKGYNIHLYSKSSIHKIKMYNYIDLTWLMMASGTLWYCDKYEKGVRVNKIFEILEKIEFIEEDVYEYIYLALIKYSDDINSIKLYEALLKIANLGKESYINYTLLCYKLSNQFNSKTKNLSFKTSKKSARMNLLMRESANLNEDNMEGENKENNAELLNSLMNNNYFRKRSLFNDYLEPKEKENDDDSDDEEDEDEEIKFENRHVCEFCNVESDLNLNRLMEMERNSEVMKFSCSNCGKDVTRGSLRIKVMCVKYSNDKDKVLSSFQTVFGLLTPYEMFKISRSFFMTCSNCKIDIETLKKSFEKLFYNFLFYFGMRNLPFDFIIPYRNRKNGSKIGNRENVKYEFSHLEIQSNCINETVISKNSQPRAVTLNEKNVGHLNKILPYNSSFEFKGRSTKKTKSVKLDYSISKVLLNQKKESYNTINFNESNKEENK